MFSEGIERGQCHEIGEESFHIQLLILLLI